METKQIIKEIRSNLKKELPGYKFSVTKRSGSYTTAITVALMKADFNPFIDAYKNSTFGDGYLQINHYYIDSDDSLSEKSKEVMKKAYEITKIRHWDKSDIQTDYSNANFYINLAIGTYERRFERI